MALLVNVKTDIAQRTVTDNFINNGIQTVTLTAVQQGLVVKDLLNGLIL